MPPSLTPAPPAIAGRGRNILADQLLPASQMTTGPIPLDPGTVETGRAPLRWPANGPRSHLPRPCLWLPEPSSAPRLLSHQLPSPSIRYTFVQLPPQSFTTDRDRVVSRHSLCGLPTAAFRSSRGCEAMDHTSERHQAATFMPTAIQLCVGPLCEARGFMLTRTQ